ncbi:hypothetical protein [Bellilinea sp.]|uniref:hypothetical protein n=1 Tax=Bellilinea sp. TaxID=2838785 RepID=UPI002ADE3303|nr:hypothetical protein [Bellilinea sp.]
MELEQLIKEYQKQQNEIKTIIGLLREVSHLEQSRNENLFKIKLKIKKIFNIIEKNDQIICLLDNLKNWVSQYQSEIMNSEKEFKKRIGTELEEELAKIELSLSGHLPKLEAGIFTIECDFERGKAKIWYGPKQEILTECYLSTGEIASQINEQKQNIGSKLPIDEFIELLRKAYYSCIEGSSHGEFVQIIKVYEQISALISSSPLIEGRESINQGSYSRSDFSYDLFRLQKHKQTNLFASQIHLKVATREYTRRRSDFLWVPQDDHGSGTTYSHLAIKEERNEQ